MPASPLATNALPALGAAALWGIGDFCGGTGVRRSGGSARAALRYILISCALSFVALLVPAALTGEHLPHGLLLVWSLLAGVAAGLGLASFYLALARGAMGTSAAVSGVLAAALPAVASAVLEGRPGVARLIGFLLAGLAIVLIGADSRQRDSSGALPFALASGVGFGLYFIALRMAAPAGLYSSLAAARVGTVCTCGTVLWLAGTRAGTATVSAGLLRVLSLGCLFDTAGTLLFAASSRAGRLDVAAVLASLYPASTILLAAALLHEHPTRRQLAGMAVALGAVVLVVR